MTNQWRVAGPWTDALTATLKLDWAKGLSAGQIAAKYGMTRNSIIGKVHRLGLAGRGSTSRGPTSQRMPRGPNCNNPFGRKGLPKKRDFPSGARSLSRRTKAPASVASAISIPRVAAPVLPHSEVVVLLPSARDPLESERVALLDLKRGQCRFPLGDKFCGRKTCSRGHRTYCKEHAARCYGGNAFRSERPGSGFQLPPIGARQ